MLQHKCRCGHVHEDAVELAEASYLISEMNQSFWREVTEDLVSFSRALEAGAASSWLTHHFGFLYPAESTGLDLAAAMQDIVRTVARRHCLLVYQCPNCQRLHLRSPGAIDGWNTFSPEPSPHGNI
jgi:hypothetical protein